jgi:photosystem II stability/assembly factor-like uncharacterized protein
MGICAGAWLYYEHLLSKVMSSVRARVRLRRLFHESLRHRRNLIMLQRLSALLGILLAGLAVGVAPVSAGDWVDITEKIKSALPEIPEDQPRFNSFVVNRGSGEVFMVVDNLFGVYRSADAGQTWSQADGGLVRGTHYYRQGAATIDPVGGNIAVFKRSFPQGPKESRVMINQSGLSLDAGKTWREFSRNPTETNDWGWSYGAVDWTAAEPKVMLARKHHTIEVWLSTDLGQNWTKLPQLGACFGVVDEKTLLIGDKDGIHRSADQGKTWTQVSEIKLITRVPSILGGKVYWLADDGVIASEDAGLTWKPVGARLQNVFWGPFFGKEESHMLVVGTEGALKTIDGGATWKKVAPAPKEFKPFFKPTTASFYDLSCWGWDPVGDILYYAGGDKFLQNKLAEIKQ